MAATTVNEAALGELTAIGRRQGRLGLDDVKRVLPVDRMSAEELAEAMARLEDAGIEVDLDPDLLRPRYDAAPPLPAAAAPAEPAAASPPRHAAGGGGAATTGLSGPVHVYPAEPAARASRGPLPADMIVLGVVLAVCIVLILFFAA
ncbi:MAG TPA: RNA polymerase sigma factor region1.1 domain-containing protein [Stellaceae bacterium]|jgi:hypothetical protein